MSDHVCPIGVTECTYEVDPQPKKATIALGQGPLIALDREIYTIRVIFKDRIVHIHNDTHYAAWLRDGRYLRTRQGDFDEDTVYIIEKNPDTNERTITLVLRSGELIRDTIVEGKI